MDKQGRTYKEVLDLIVGKDFEEKYALVSHAIKMKGTPESKNTIRYLAAGLTSCRMRSKKL